MVLPLIRRRNGKNKKMAARHTCTTRSLFCKLVIVIILSILGIFLSPRAQYTQRNASTDHATVEQVSFLPLNDKNGNKRSKRTVTANDTTTTNTSFSAANDTIMLANDTVVISHNKNTTRTTLVALSRRKKKRKVMQTPRDCTSPEFKTVEWPLNGSIVSRSSTLTCGLATDTPLSNFFSNLSTSLSHQYSKECKQAVRFGVAFGGDYASKLRPRKRPPHKCAFTFVLEEEMPPPPSDEILSFGFETLLPVPRHVLPYTSTRRNVKLFKLHGHLLFPFTKLLVWSDVKLKGKYFIPSEYFAKFLKTSSSSSNACVAAVGLPSAVASFGQVSTRPNYVPTYQDHCSTVVNSIQKRPNVTDSTHALLRQCRLYRNQQQVVAAPSSNSSATRRATLVSLHRGLIDSAFIVWNQHSSRCKEFNAELACTWSDEIACHSDRDQISFPRVLQQMNLVEADSSTNKSAITHSLELVGSKNNKSMVHILKSNCHWYFGSFPRLCTELTIDGVGGGGK